MYYFPFLMSTLYTYISIFAIPEMFTKYLYKYIGNLVHFIYLYKYKKYDTISAGNYKRSERTGGIA